MFPGNTEPELEVGFLRSGSRFRSGKRRKIEEGPRAPSLFEVSEHKLRSKEEKGSCDEEEDYSPILEGVKELEESTETPRSRCNYITPGVSSKTRSRF